MLVVVGVRVDRLAPHHLEGARTFVSQAVIQHFQSREYVADFLRALDAAASVQWTMLQVREVPKGTAGRDVRLATSVTGDELEALLPSFPLTWRSKRYRNGYVFYTFQRNAQV